MRLNYYRFPENTDDAVRLREGCAVILKNGSTIYPDHIPDDKRRFVDRIDDIVGPLSVTTAKQLLRKYGGSAWTEHYERDGSLFETTPINLTGNNTRFKYNHHL